MLAAHRVASGALRVNERRLVRVKVRLRVRVRVRANLARCASTSAAR